MKQIIKISAFVIALALAFAGCRRESAFDPSTQTPSDAVGYISFASDPLQVEFEGENVNNPSPRTRAAYINVEAFNVQIINDETEAIEKEFIYRDRGQEPIPLTPGRYYIKVYSAEMKDTAWDTEDGQPTYGAQSKVFEVTVDNTKENPKEIETITCKLQSVKVTVSLESGMADKCEEGATTIDVTLSETHTLTFDDTEHPYGVVNLKQDEDGKFSVESTRRDSSKGYLKPLQEYNSLTLNISTTYDGQPVDFKQHITDQAKAGEWRKIYLYIQTAEEQGGSIVINAVIETWVYDEKVNVEISKLAPTMSEDAIPDIDDPDAPRIESPDFTFHDTTNISAASYDSNGEFNGNASIKISTTSAISRFAVQMTTDNSMFQSFLAANGLLDKSVNLMDNANTSTLLARTQLKNWGFPSRERIEESAHNITFDIKSFFKHIKDFSGSHKVVIGITDAEGHYSRADLTIAVTSEGTSTDPNPGDGAPHIVWEGYDFAQEYDADEVTCKFDVYAPKRIAKLMGTLQGAIAEEIESQDLMPLSFDLCDPETYKEGLAEALGMFRIPTGDEVKGHTHVELDITDFLGIFPTGQSQFILEVTDEDGQTDTQTIRLKKNE